MNADLEFRLLGRVEVVRGGTLVELGGGRQRRLLALLAAEVGRVVSPSRLIDELWPEAPPTNAESTLRTYVSKLRRAIGADVLPASAGGYMLDVAPETLDARRFERLQQEGRQALDRGAAGVARDRLGAALDLWRGPAYGDIADTPSLTRDAQRLDELRLACVEQRIAADLALGAHHTVVAELQALVRQHPWRELLWQHLILALYRSDRQADALAAYREAQANLEVELGVDPGPQLQQLERDVLRHQVEAVAVPAHRHNLPAATTRLIGRERELDELTSLLRERRLVVLTGMGGSGKTKLALEIARRQLDAWPHGVWFVDLATVTDPLLVPVVVGETVAVTDLAAAPVQSLVEHVRRLELLLVLDNCEHLAHACAELVTTVLRECAYVRVLATSRVPLGVYGEVDYALEPLPTAAAGADPQTLSASPAVELFRERAAAVRRDVESEAGAMQVISDICRDLDGLPLAIEIAAARTKSLSLREVSCRLDDRFRFLRAWQRVANPRHAALQTTMDWSYALLQDAEQRLLRRLAVFGGSASLDAILEVCGDGDGTATEEGLQRLVEASLLQLVLGETARFRMLETVRQYAAAKLADDPSASLVQRRYAEHCLRLAEQANLAYATLARGPRPEVVIVEQHNLRAALDWAVTGDPELALRMMIALENLWISFATLEGARRYDELLPLVERADVRLRAHAERDRAACFDVLDDFDRARAGYLRSRDLFEQCGDEDGVAAADFRLGILEALQNNDNEAARLLLEQSLRTWMRTGNEVGIIEATTNLGGLAVRTGDPRGQALIREGIDRARAINWWWWVCVHLGRHACIAVEAGDAGEAERLALEALEAAVSASNRPAMLQAVAVLARVAVMRGDSERAAELWSAVESVEGPPGRFWRFDREAYRATIPAGPTRRALTLDEAVAVARS